MNSLKTKNRISNFFKNEYKKMVSFINKIIDDSYYVNSEDIIQDVMLKLFSKSDILEPVENLGGYIYSALKNGTIDIIKGKKETIPLDTPLNDEEVLTLEDVLSDMRYNVLNEVEKKYIKEKLYNAISSLDEASKSVALATEFENRLHLVIFEFYIKKK